MKAIRRLIDDERFEEARARISVLRQQYPGHRPLLAMAWEIEDQAGSLWEAAARAYDWAQASPGSELAQMALVGAAFDANLRALSAATAQRLASLRGIPVEPLEDVNSALGAMSGEEAMLADLSGLLLQDARYDEIAERLKDARHPSLRNNLGIALFLRGDVAPALAEFEDNWRQQRLNAFALEKMVRLRLWCQGREYAAELVPALQSCVPRRAEDALGKLSGLILLGEWDAAEASWQDVPALDPLFGRRDSLRGLYAYAGTVLAQRRGDMAAAEERQRVAMEANPDHDSVLDLAPFVLSASGAGGYQAGIGEIGAWLPLSWHQRLLELGGQETRNVDERWRQCLQDCSAHADYLGLAAEFGGQTVGMIAMEILKLRTREGDLQAQAQLISLLTRPCGADSNRMRLLSWLRENNVTGDMPMPVLAKGRVTSVRPASIRLTPEATRENPYPPDVAKHYEDMIKLLQDGRVREALAKAVIIRELAPQVPMSHANLAMAKESIEADDEEIEALFRAALDLDEHYLFARAGLARVLVRRGELDAADTMLAPVFAREEFHFSEWRAVLHAQFEIALARGQTETVIMIERSLRDLDDMEQR
ncbi:MAG: hypothetical protein V4632_11160 [Pseudomonadota bacterium]